MESERSCFDRSLWHNDWRRRKLLRRRIWVHSLLSIAAFSKVRHVQPLYLERSVREVFLTVQIALEGGGTFALSINVNRLILRATGPLIRPQPPFFHFDIANDDRSEY